MHSKSIAYCFRLLLVFVAILTLGGCGKKGPLEGTYASPTATYVFKGDTVTVTATGAPSGAQMKYVVNGKKVTFTAGKYQYEGDINEDGTVVTMGASMANEKLVKK